MSDNKEFSFEILQDIGIFDDKGNQSLEAKVIAWNGKDAKLELRKWLMKDGEPQPQKGFSFLTEDGPHRLSEMLVENGYGDTQVLLDLIKSREDYDVEEDEDYLDEDDDSEEDIY